MQAVAAISYFHRKIGPMVYFAYPQTVLSDEEKHQVANNMDTPYEEGFYSQKFGDLTSINYYFEIYSDWARGHKEMLMISFILNISPSVKIEEKIKEYCLAFIEKLKSDREMYKCFYKIDDEHVEEEDIPKIKKYRNNLQFWVKELYWTGIEGLRERTEEEKWASIMAKPEIFRVIKKLSRGPLSMDDLKKWFRSMFPDFDLLNILEKLEEEKFVFVNTIGQETFVLLVKEVNIMRIPPGCVIDLEEDPTEMADLNEIYINEVRDFFESYSPTPMDSLVLFKLFANPKIYNVISQLREGPLPKEKILSMVSEESMNELMSSLKLLEQYNIIQPFFYGKVYLYLLKTDVVLTANFPEYLKRLLPKKSKDYRAQKYSPENLRLRQGDAQDLPFGQLNRDLDLPSSMEIDADVSVLENLNLDSSESQDSVTGMSKKIEDRLQHQDFTNEDPEIKNYISSLQKDLLKDSKK